MIDAADLTADDIVALVERMRHKQKEYFRTHTIVVLEESKTLEREVDQAIRQYRQPKII